MVWGCSNTQKSGVGRLEIPDKKVIGGIAAVIVGLALVAIGAALAAGVFGGGLMYILAGSAEVLSIPVFIVAAVLLCKKPPAYDQIGNKTTVTTDKYMPPNL